MQTLKSVYEDYEDRVTILGIGTDPSEGEGDVRSYSNRHGYPWEMAPYNGNVLLEYRITSQSSKVVIDGNGVITYRGGYGSLSSREWREALDEVAG